MDDAREGLFSENEVRDFLQRVESIADEVAEQVGIRPDCVFLGPGAAVIARRVVRSDPGLSSQTRPHTRPMGFPDSANWICRIGEIDVYGTLLN